MGLMASLARDLCATSRLYSSPAVRRQAGSRLAPQQKSKKAYCKVVLKIGLESVMRTSPQTIKGHSATIKFIKPQRAQKLCYCTAVRNQGLKGTRIAHRERQDMQSHAHREQAPERHSPRGVRHTRSYPTSEMSTASNVPPRSTREERSG